MDKTPEDILPRLIELGGRPSQILREQSDAFAIFGDDRVSINALRRFLAANETVADELVDKGVHLNWVLEGIGQRVDISPDAEALSEQLEKLASRPWSVAQTLRDVCLQTAKSPELLGLEGVERVLETLAGLSVALRRTLHASARQERPRLSITRKRDSIYAQWQDQKVEEFEFLPFVRRQAIRFGEFSGMTAELVASNAVEMVLVGALEIPGFEPPSPISGGQMLRLRSTILREG
jgi:hypothetical protein